MSFHSEIEKYNRRAKRVLIGFQLVFVASFIALWIMHYQPSIAPTAFLSAYANKYETAQASTALIKTSTGSGSGVVVRRGDRLFVFTANHVMGSDNLVLAIRTLRWNSHKAGNVVFAAKVIANFPEADAALLWLDAPPTAFAAAEWGNTVPTGTAIFHVGNFFGADFDGSVSRGIVSQVGVNPDEEGWPWVLVDQTDARSVPGSSGGPVFDNTTGKIIGLLVGGPNRGALGISCFIPVREIETVVIRAGFGWALRGNSAPSDTELEKIFSARKKQKESVTP